MDIIQRLVSNVLLIEIKTELASAVSVEHFSNILREHIYKGQKNVVINLSDINYFNSSHIGMLVSGYTTVKNGGGDMRLASLSDRVRKALEINRLNLVFDIYPSVDEAIDSYN